MKPFPLRFLPFRVARYLGTYHRRSAATCAAAFLCVFFLALPASRAQVAPVCSPNGPAPLSGSTGAQGVLDPTNANSAAGLVWPAGAVTASISMDTGVVSFFDATPASLGSASLPGVGGVPAFPTGILNFISVHLTPGTTVAFTTSVLGFAPPVIILSCQDVVLDAGSSLTATASLASGPLPGDFLGGLGPGVSGGGAAGFGPRTGSLPAAGSLYPAIGGGGGSGGTTQAGNGGAGGPAIIISADQRITLNGSVNAAGLAGSSSGAQGGAGGSVRLASLLVEGSGTVNTNAGADSDSVVRSPAGPVEVQAFLEDDFAGTATTTPIRGSAPVQPVPSNLPLITIESLCDCSLSSTGSLTTPDYPTLNVTVSTAQVVVPVPVFTQNVPDGTILLFRAVGTDGSVSSNSAAVSSSLASANLTLNAGIIYQIVVTPNTPFPSLVLDPAPGFEVARSTSESQSAKLNRQSAPSPDAAVKPVDMVRAEQWMKAFAMPVEIASNSSATAGEASGGSGNVHSSNLIGSLR